MKIEIPVTIDGLALRRVTYLYYAYPTVHKPPNIRLLRKAVYEHSHRIKQQYDRFL